MNPTKTFVLIFIFVIGNSFGQTRTDVLIHGKIIADSASVEGINVVNLVNEKATTTDKKGEFYILAKAEDLLVLSAVNFEFHRRSIEEADLKGNIVIIKMIPKVTQLDEVIVNEHPDITAEKLGIIPKGQKRYTPAERKLYTAQTGPVDILANIISGRTKMLKKEVEVEKKERLLAKVEVLYEDDYYTETLKIPQDYISDFQHYLIDDAEFVSAMNAKNKALIRFNMAKLAVNYKELVKPE